MTAAVFVYFMGMALFAITMVLRRKLLLLLLSLKLPFLFTLVSGMCWVFYTLVDVLLNSINSSKWILSIVKIVVTYFFLFVSWYLAERCYKKVIDNYKGNKLSLLQKKICSYVALMAILISGIIVIVCQNGYNGHIDSLVTILFTFLISNMFSMDDFFNDDNNDKNNILKTIYQNKKNKLISECNSRVMMGSIMAGFILFLIYLRVFEVSIELSNSIRDLLVWLLVGFLNAIYFYAILFFDQLKI